MADAAGEFSYQSGDPEELSFDALRRLGITFAQGLAADNWTDYNVHDPGVTLLEQICYALTDLVYRSGFDVADQLTSPDGKIDFERLGLELPERIFPCRPATLTDYRRAILDAVPDIDDVTVRPKEGGAAGTGLPRGLYDILVRPGPGTTDADWPQIRSAVERSYSRLRNLCEDVQEITLVNECEFEIVAVVEVERSRNPEEILAEIYHRCAERVASRVHFQPFENALRSDRSLEQMLTGPLGQHGFCDEEDLRRVETSYSVADFFTLINAVEGVAQVADLYFQMGGKIRRDSISSGRADQVLRLHIPGNPDQVQIRLSRLGRSLSVPFASFKNRLEVLVLKSSGSERVFQDARKLYSEPQSEYRNLRQYTSIQTHLPSIYRVGAVGLSDAVAPEIRARSRQLKGYLLLFDQLMANSAAHVASLKGLYSWDGQSDTTYASQLMDGSQISGLDGIYPPQPADVMATIVARCDNFTDRKGRLLNYLLALYGESFSQNSLRTLNFYATPGESDRALLENRALFLHAIAELTRDRGAAADYLDPAQTTVSGLQHRVSALLGFVDYRHRALTAAFREHGLRPVSDNLIMEPRPEEEELSRCNSSAFQLPDNSWEDEVPLLAETESDPSCESGQLLSRLVEQVGHLLPASGGKVQEGILRAGISFAKYRLGHIEGSADWQAFLLPDDAAPWWRLGAFTDRHAAIVAVNKLRRLIVLLNTECEGMHVVEHVLLRPGNAAAGKSAPFVPAADFFSLRLSVVFPAWTARFQDARFRQLARETVRLNCPAHIIPEVIWLGFDDMLQFEQLQADWLHTCCDEGATATGLDDAAARMVGFLVEHRGEACWALVPNVDIDKVPGE